MDFNKLLTKQLQRFQELRTEFEKYPVIQIINDTYSDFEKTIKNLRYTLADALLQTRALDKELKSLLEEEKKFFKMIAQGESLEAVLELISANFNSHFPHALNIIFSRPPQAQKQIQIIAAHDLDFLGEKICQVRPKGCLAGDSLYNNKNIVNIPIATAVMDPNVKKTIMETQLKYCNVVPILSSKEKKLGVLMYFLPTDKVLTSSEVATIKRTLYLIGFALERDFAQIAQQKTQERFSLALLGSQDGIWDWDVNNDSIYFSPRWKSLLDYHQQDGDISIEQWLEMLHPNEDKTIRLKLFKLLMGKSNLLEIEHQIYKKNGDCIWVLTRGIALRNEMGTYRIAGSMSDITKRKVAEQKLIYQANHDSLTGLINRSQIIAKIKQAIQKTKETPDYHFAVLFFDLDRFKVINDSLGHIFGDKLLKQLSIRMKAAVTKADVVARLGGDEFVIFLDNLSDSSDATSRTFLIQQIFREPFIIDDHEIFTDASIGITLSSPDYTYPGEMLRDADLAMYKAKSEGKARYSLFNKTMLQGAISQLKTETKIRKAIENEDMLVYYQPIISLHSGKIASCEALLRFKDPSIQNSIQDIITMTEQTGLIKRIGGFVLESACSFINDIHKNENPDLQLAVNVSPQQILDEYFVNNVKKILNQTKINPTKVTLELTEGIMIDSSEATLEKMNHLKSFDLKLSIDDFGTGFSSLSYLQKFPIDYLKVDRSFLMGTPEDEGNSAITASIITLGHILGLQVIAEGIESQSQLDFIKSFECDYFQGYLASRPLPENEFRVLLQKSPSFLDN